MPRAQAAQKLPVILIRTPYTPSSEVSELLAPALLARAVRSGYAIVIVNDRGTQWSEGQYQWLKGANQDGSDILDWITQQPWSNGKSERSAAHRAARASLRSPPSIIRRTEPWWKWRAARPPVTFPATMTRASSIMAACQDLAWSWWYHRFGLKDRPVMPADISQDTRVRIAASYSPEPWYGEVDFASLAGHLPSQEILQASGVPRTEWDRLIRLAPASPEWKNYDFVRDGDRTRVPGLHIDSWYDVIEAYPTVKMFQYLSGNSPNQHLVMGPTAHCRMGTETEATSVGDRSVGDGRFGYVEMILHWYDRWLKARVPGAAGGTVLRAQLQPMADGAGLAAPGRSTRSVFTSRARAMPTARRETGCCARRGHPGRRPTNSSTIRPTPFRRSAAAAARGRSRATSRPSRRVEDVLVYTSRPFAEATRIVGDVDVTLSVSSSAPDTDLMVKLVDVDAGRPAYNLGDTAVRMRYRDGFAHPALMQPGKPDPVKITGLVTASDFLPGHRLRIEVAGTNSPNYERNLHSGGHNYDESAARPARIDILHDAQHPSFVEFTTMPR